MDAVRGVLLLSAAFTGVVTASDRALDLDSMQRELSERVKRSPMIRFQESCETESGTYQHNQLIPHPDPCATCHCHHGQEICMMVMCGYPMCVDRDMNPDICCNTCPNGDNCWLDGKIVSAERPVIQTNGHCTRYCSCPRSMEMYRRYEEMTFAHCIVHCEEDDESAFLMPAAIKEGTAIGNSQVEPDLPIPEMYSNQQGK